MTGISAILRQLHSLMATPRTKGQSDSHLLEQFVSRRDDVAFAGLLERHGPMVLGVCRRILHDEHRAEDAFQATFLVLVRKAVAIRKQESIASWLHGVALRIANRAKVEAARAAIPVHASCTVAADTCKLASCNESHAILDDELQRLPENYRLPLVLCYLEGLTRDEAAAQLGWTANKLRGNLERGRDRLRSQLLRRGVTLSAAASATLLTDTILAASIPPLLTVATLHAAARLATGATLSSCGISGPVIALTQGGLKMVASKKVSVVFALALVALIIGTGVSILACWSEPVEVGRPIEPLVLVIAQEPLKKVEPKEGRVDSDSDPLPEGAVTRLGFGKFRAGGVTDVVFSPDGKYLAAKTYSDIIHVWDVKTGRSVRKFTLESSRQMKFGKQGLIPDASRFSFSADGKSIVAYQNADDHAWQRNVETGEEEKLPGDLSSKKLCALQFSTDGKALVAIHEDLTVKLHDPKSGKEIVQVAKLPDRNSSAAVTFSKNGQSLLLPKYDEAAGKAVIDVIDVKTGKAVRTLEASPKYGIKHVTTTADGSKVFAIDTIQIHAWDAGTGQDINDFSRRIGSPFDSFALSPDDKTLVILHGYNVVFWDLVGSKPIRRVRLGIGHRSLAIAPDGKTLAVGSGQSVKFLDMATGEVLHKIGGHESRIAAVALSPDGKFAFTAASDRQVQDWKSPFITLRRWDARTGEALKADTLDDTDHSFELIFSRDAKKLAFRRYQPLGSINDFQIWNTADGSLAHAIKGKWPWKLAFDPAGRHLAISFLNATFELYDADKGTELRAFAGTVNTTTAPAFSPDGKNVAAWRSRGHPGTLTDGGHIHIFETESGKELSKIAFETGVSDLRYTPDGQFLAISSLDTIHLWDVANRKVLREIKAGSGPFALSEDSKFLTTGDRYGAVEVWSVETGKRVGRHEGHNDRISSVAFSPDGARLITGSVDGIAIIWDFAKLTAGRSPSPK